MATGPDHYRVAEQHIGFAQNSDALDMETVHLGYAQVHATLALAAATAMGTAPGGMGPVDLEAWDEVCGVQEEELDDESIDAGGEWRLAEREHGDWLAAEPVDLGTTVPVEYHVEPPPSDIPAPEGRY